MKRKYTSSFTYPKSKHNRKYRLTKQRFGNRSIKIVLRREFYRTCVYCRLHDICANKDNFGVEHYLPKSQYPDLAFDYTNLYYSCNICNRNKGAFFPSSKLPNIYIPNPCDHVMFSHVRFDKEKAIPLSPQGKHMVELLRLNNRMRQVSRKVTIQTIEMANEKIMRLENTVKNIKRLLRQTETTELRNDLNLAQSKIKEVQATLFNAGAKLL